MGIENIINCNKFYLDDENNSKFYKRVNGDEKDIILEHAEYGKYSCWGIIGWEFVDEVSSIDKAIQYIKDYYGIKGDTLEELGYEFVGETKTWVLSCKNRHFIKISRDTYVEGRPEHWHLDVYKIDEVIDSKSFVEDIGVERYLNRHYEFMFD